LMFEITYIFSENYSDRLPYLPHWTNHGNNIRNRISICKLSPLFFVTFCWQQYIVCWIEIKVWIKFSYYAISVFWLFFNDNSTFSKIFLYHWIELFKTHRLKYVSLTWDQYSWRYQCLKLHTFFPKIIRIISHISHIELIMEITSETESAYAN
jgi:hypothetical protein